MTLTAVITAWIVGTIIGLIMGIVFNPTKMGIAFNMFGGLIGGGFGFQTLGIWGPKFFSIHLFPTIFGAILLSVFLTIVLQAINKDITYKNKIV